MKKTPAPEAASDADVELASYAGAFAGVAEEARRGAELCDRLQESAMLLLSSYSGPDRARLMGELQHLDAVTQMLTSLASFAHLASSHARHRTPIDFDKAVSQIGLSDMAYRLRIACFDQLEDDWRLEGDESDLDLF